MFPERQVEIIKIFQICSKNHDIAKLEFFLKHLADSFTNKALMMLEFCAEDVE